MTSNSIFDKNMETVSTKEGEELTQGLQETPGDYSERPLAPLPFRHSSLSSFACGTRECTGLSGPRDFLFTEALWFRKATGCSTMLEATRSCQCQNPPAPWVPRARSSHPPVVSVSLRENREFSPAVAGEHSPRSGSRSDFSINSDKTQSVLYHATGLLSFPVVVASPAQARSYSEQLPGSDLGLVAFLQSPWRSHL